MDEGKSMGWHQQIASALRGIGVATFAVVGLAHSPGWAQSQYDVFSSGALAIAAYEASKKQCVYSDKMGKALADIDAFLNRQDAYRWDESKRLAPDGMTGPRNMARMQGASDCKVYGLFIGNAAIVYFNAAAFDQAVFAEFNQLLKGEGRGISGEAEARPPQPPTPGSAAAMIAEYNRQNPNLNQGSDTGPGPTMRRPSSDGPSSGVSRSQLPPRQSAEPSPRRERTTPPLLPEATPLVAPPIVAPQPARPAVSSSSDCRAAGDCRASQPTFACNLDDAARIAGAGPDAGRQAGLAAVRAGHCEIVAASRSLKIEATKSPNVVYATEQGRHVGYLPVGVFAPADQAMTAPCRAAGFCAVRPGMAAWICPQPDDLSLPTTEAKRTARCLQISDNTVGEVVQVVGPTAALVNLFGGAPPYEPRYYAAQADLMGISVKPTPTPASRGWCRPGDWCITSVGALFCSERAANERVMRLPPGEGRVSALRAEAGCRVVIAGSPLKPDGVSMAGNGRKLIEVEHPILGKGWASADAFKLVAFTTPIQHTSQLSDLIVSVAKSPSFVAVGLSAQGTSEASGSFRAGPKERLAFCKNHWSDDNASALRSCLAEPDTTITVKADCSTKRISLDRRRYELRERPGDVPPDIHTDLTRRWLFRDLANGKWLDGTTVSGEATVSTAFNALCPGIDPEATSSLVYRDPRAVFPRELQGRWYDDRRACGDPRRNTRDYDEHGWMVISAEDRVGSREYEWPQRINAVRTVGRGAWEIDGSHRIDDVTVPEIFQSSIYQLTRDGFVLRQLGGVSEWVRCR